MRITLSADALYFFRFTLAIQVATAIWFIFSPDLVPEVFRDLERQNDQPTYEILDNIIVPLIHVQTILCIVLWQPTKIASWAFLLVAGMIAALMPFSGPGISSSIDNLFGYLQTLASGAMLCALFLNKAFSFSAATNEVNA